MKANIKYNEYIKAKSTHNILGLTEGKEYGLIGYGRVGHHTIFIINDNGHILECNLKYFILNNKKIASGQQK